VTGKETAEALVARLSDERVYKQPIDTNAASRL
jgi:hypothetical protein